MVNGSIHSTCLPWKPTFVATSRCGNYRLAVCDSGEFWFLERITTDDGISEWIATDTGDDDGIGYLHIFA